MSYINYNKWENNSKYKDKEAQVKKLGCIIKAPQTNEIWT